MKWNIRKRLEFIESRLLWEEKISRKDLVEFFDISIPQATKDFKLYQEQAPNSLHYDNSAKQYVAAGGGETFFVSGKSQSYLSHLLVALLSKAKDVFLCGTIPPAYQMPNPGRVVEESVLKIILKCIHTGGSVKIEYQSMSSPEPTTRWISPHALGYDGHRWHTRCLCHKHKQYRDFNLGRVLSVGEIKEGSYDHSNDFLWYDNVTFRIAAHKGLTPSQKKCIELDYSMVNGEAEISVKAAFHFYLRQRLKLTKGHEDKPAIEQQIILLNEDEIATKIKLLKEIEQTRLEPFEFLECK